MDLRRLRYFVVTAEELNFSRAAERLHVTQPTLSGSIRQLEIELGAELFIRSGRHIVLSWPGSVLLDQARRILRIVADAVEATRGAVASDLAMLRVGAVDSNQPGILSKAFARSRYLLPELSLSVYALSTARQLRVLTDKCIDVGLVIGLVEGHAVAAEILWTEPLVMAVASGHPMSGRPSIDFKELEGASIIAPDPEADPGYHAGIVKCCRDAGFEPQISDHAGHWETMLNLVSAGVGVALIPTSLDTTRYPNVATVPMRDVGAEVPIVAAWRQGEDSPTLHAFIAALKSSRFASKERSAESQPRRAAFSRGAPSASGKMPDPRR